MAARSLKYPEHTDFKVRLVPQQPCALSHLFRFPHEPAGLPPAGPGCLWQRPRTLFRQKCGCRVGDLYRKQGAGAATADCPAWSHYRWCQPARAKAATSDIEEAGTWAALSSKPYQGWGYDGKC